jgi:sodium pump decarboxylase gamma subunit
MENITLGIQVAMIGMGVVFVTLIILAFFTAGMSKMLTSAGKVKKEIEQTYNAAAPTLEEVVQHVQQEEITSNIHAVITAAVAAVLNSRNTYRIKTIKRIDSDLNSSWNRLIKHEQLKTW